MVGRNSLRTGVNLAVVFVLAMSCHSRVLAAGCFVTRPGGEALHVTGMRAAVVFDDGLEELLLEVDFLDAPVEFGWIVPVPAESEIRASRNHVFIGIEDWEPEFARSPRTGRVAALLGSSRSAASGVDVLDAMVIPPSDKHALSDWLNQHQFEIPDRVRTVVDEYSNRGWYLAALRVRASEVSGKPLRSQLGATTFRGTTQLVRLLFRTPEPIYPLRICAALTQPVDVTLCVASDTALVAVESSQEWSTHLMQMRDAPRTFGGEENFPALDAARARVTKLRSFVNPHDAVDVTFRPYDPIEVLDHDDEQLRAEAVSEIGRQRRIEDVERVIYVLGTCEPRAPLAIAAIWALGELGGEASQRALLKWAGSPVIECRFEALESLARLRCSEALPLFLEIVGRPRAERSPIGWEASERQACWEHLVAFGDPTCIPELTEMVAPFPDREWGLALDAPYGAALNPYAALAACGDSSALAALHDFLIIEVQNMVRDPIFPSSRGGSINGFPGCYLLGQCVLYPERCLENIRIAAAIRILEPRSELRDAFLRNVARDPRTPDGGTIYLLSRLASPNSLDIELLLDIARRAIGPGAIHIECAVSQRGGSENTRVSYNAHACGVAYAFAQLKSVEGLLRLWDECPRYDLALRAEIAYAFARLGAAEGIQPVLEYTEAAWNERVASLEYRDAVSARLASDSRGGPSEDLLDLDVRYRQQEIVRFLRGRKSNRDVMLHLVTSKRIHPLMRLRWIGESTRMQGLWPWFGDDALDALSAIERASTDHVVVALAAAVRRDIDRYRAFASDWERRLQ